jgi:hypothetical protein
VRSKQPFAVAPPFTAKATRILRCNRKRRWNRPSAPKRTNRGRDDEIDDVNTTKKDDESEDDEHRAEAK